MKRPNLYRALELDPSVDDWPEIERAIEAKVALWTRWKAQGNKRQRHEAPHLLALEAEMRTLLADPGARRLEATAARLLLDEARDSALAELERAIRLLRRTGRCSAERLAKLVQKFGDTLGEDEIRRRLEAAGIFVDPGAPLAEPLEPSLAKRLHDRLGALSHPHLYAFLGTGPDTPADELRRRAEQRLAECRRTGKTDATATAIQELAGECASLFADPEGKARYDTTRAVRALADVLEIAGDSGSIDAATAAALFEQAAEQDVDLDLARAYVLQVADERGWRVELPTGPSPRPEPGTPRDRPAPPPPGATEPPRATEEPRPTPPPPRPQRLGGWLGDRRLLTAGGVAAATLALALVLVGTPTSPSPPAAVDVPVPPPTGAAPPSPPAPVGTAVPTSGAGAAASTTPAAAAPPAITPPPTGGTPTAPVAPSAAAPAAPPSTPAPTPSAPPPPPPRPLPASPVMTVVALGEPEEIAREVEERLGAVLRDTGSTVVDPNASLRAAEILARGRSGVAVEALLAALARDGVHAAVVARLSPAGSRTLEHHLGRETLEITHLSLNAYRTAGGRSMAGGWSGRLELPERNRARRLDHVLGPPAAELAAAVTDAWAAELADP